MTGASIETTLELWAGIVTPASDLPARLWSGSQMKKLSYAGYRFPREIIHQAIWLYLCFTLSFRDV